MLLPISLDVKRKRCLVVGGGPVAARKVRSLLECGAHVVVVSPHLCDDFETLRPHIEYSMRLFHSEDCANCLLIFACTSSREVNEKIAVVAQDCGVLCNVADDSAPSDFANMATVRRGEITVAISTDGGSPALSKHLKANIEKVIGDEYAQLLKLMSERRAKIEYSNAQTERANKWRSILRSDVLDLLRNGETDAASKRVDEILNAPAPKEPQA